MLFVASRGDSHEWYQSLNSPLLYLSTALAGVEFSIPAKSFRPRNKTWAEWAAVENFSDEFYIGERKEGGYTCVLKQGRITDFSKFDIYNWIYYYRENHKSAWLRVSKKKFNLFSKALCHYSNYITILVFFIIQFFLSKFSKIILFSFFESRGWIFLQSMKGKSFCE